MPKDEDIEAICLGQGWVACATSALLVRVFTVGGVQKEIFSLPGPVVSMAGHGEQLMVIYHRGSFPLSVFFEPGFCFQSSVTAFKPWLICTDHLKCFLLFWVMLIPPDDAFTVTTRRSLTAKPTLRVMMPGLSCRKGRTS